MGQILNSGQLHLRPRPRWISRRSCLKTPKKSNQKYPPFFPPCAGRAGSLKMPAASAKLCFLPCLHASKELDSIFIEAFASLSVVRPVGVSAVITHSQDITGSLQHSLKLFPEKMPVDVSSDYKNQQRHQTQAVEMCRSCTAHTVHCTWEGLMGWIKSAPSDKSWPSLTKSFNQQHR